MATGLDPAENRRSVTDRLAAAAGAGATLVVFPEATMATFGGPSFDLSTVAEPLDGAFVSSLAAGAARHGITVVAGMFERAGASPSGGGERPPDAERVYNTVVVVGPEGLLGAYRKVHLFDALGARESDRVLPGDPADGLVALPLDEGLVLGVLTCYDLRFPESARALVDRGATLLAVPAHWYNGPGKPQVWRTLLAARAIESTAYVVGAGKPEPEAVGRSAVVDPLGEVLAELGGEEEGVALAEVSAARVAAVRTMLPVLEHRRFGVVPGKLTPQAHPSEPPR